MDLEISFESDTLKIIVHNGNNPFYRAITGDISREDGVESTNLKYHNPQPVDNNFLFSSENVKSTDSNIFLIPIKDNSTKYIHGHMINFDIVRMQQDSTRGYEKGVFNYFKVNVRDSLDEL